MGKLNGSKIVDSAAASDKGAVYWNVSTNVDGYLDNMIFEAGTGTSNHAIEFGSSSGQTHSLRGISFSDYNASNAQTDSTLYFADTGADVTWTINLVGCSGTVTYKQARVGDTISLIVDPVTTGITVKDLTTGTLLQNARVLVWPTDATNFIYQEAFTLSGTGTAATATIDSGLHGLSTNDYVIVAGASDDAYNGTFQITVSSTTVFTYTTVDTITTGSGVSADLTFAFISGLTNASGYISDTRSISTSQPISGRVRLSSTTISSKTVYLKQGVISGTVNNTTGFSTTVQLVRDE